MQLCKCRWRRSVQINSDYLISESLFIQERNFAKFPLASHGPAANSQPDTQPHKLNQSQNEQKPVSALVDRI